MLSTARYFKVLNSVVGFDSIFMVDNFGRKQLSSEKTTHDISMLKHLSADATSSTEWGIGWWRHQHISERIERFCAFPVTIIFAPIRKLFFHGLYITTLFLLSPELSKAEQTKYIFNPMSGKLDAITVLSSTTLPSGSTQYIQNRSTLQSGATFFVSSAAISGPLRLYPPGGASSSYSLLFDMRGSVGVPDVFTHTHTGGLGFYWIETNGVDSSAIEMIPTQIAFDVGGTDRVSVTSANTTFSNIPTAPTLTQNERFGARSLFVSTNTADFNACGGYQSCFALSSGAGANAGWGANTLRDNTTGYQNSAFGVNAGAKTKGLINSYFGYAAGGECTWCDATIAFGAYALGSLPRGTGNLGIGYQSGYNINSEVNGNWLAGFQSGYGLTGGSYNLMGGYQVGLVNPVTGNFNILYGYDAETTDSDTSYAGCIGYQCRADDLEFVFGGNDFGYKNFYVGSGRADATPSSTTIQGTNGLGSNITGADVTLSAGRGTGTGSGGILRLQVSTAGVSGTSLNPPINVLAAGTTATFFIDVNGPIEAYDATSWNGSPQLVTQDAIRDKIETLGGGSGASSLAVTTGTQAGFAVVIASPTAVINANNAQFGVTLTANNTAYLYIIDGGIGTLEAEDNSFTSNDLAADSVGESEADEGMNFTPNGDWNFGGAQELSIPVDAAPVFSDAGSIALDSSVNGWFPQVVYSTSSYSDATTAVGWYLLSISSSEMHTVANGEVPTYNAATDQFLFATPAGGSGPTERNVFISATAGLCQLTSGCRDPEQYETATTSTSYVATTFTSGTTQYWQANFMLPEDYEDSTDVTARVIWSSTATSTIATWNVDMKAVAHDDSLDGPWSSTVVLGSTTTAVGDLIKTGESSGIGPAGSPLSGSELFVRVYRGNTGDARFHGIQLKYQLD